MEIAMELVARLLRQLEMALQLVKAPRQVMVEPQPVATRP
jgi:hypothetical protein